MMTHALEILNASNRSNAVDIVSKSTGMSSADIIARRAVVTVLLYRAGMFEQMSSAGTIILDSTLSIYSDNDEIISASRILRRAAQERNSQRIKSAMKLALRLFKKEYSRL